MDENKSGMLPDERAVLAHCILMLSYMASDLGRHDLLDTFSRAIKEPLARLKQGAWKETAV